MSDLENMKIINDLQNRISELVEEVTDLKQSVNGLKLNEQKHLSANTPIPPGIACKFAYDANGLILKAMPLVASDIPMIDIDTVKGLKTLLDEKISESELERLTIQLNNSITKRSNTIAATGCKANIDANGFVVSVSDLTEEDIPIIGISKVKGLAEILEVLQSSSSGGTSIIEDVFKVEPGTGCKVNYDNKGRILSSIPLDINDIPMDLITKINEIEAKIPLLAAQATVSSLIQSIGSKLDKNNPITSGTFTKVFVDSKGLVTKGEKLTKDDLPSLSISDIEDLEKELRSKASQSDITDLNEMVTNVYSIFNKLGDVNSFKTLLDSKAEIKEVKELRNSVIEVEDLMQRFIEKVPSDTIMDTLQDMQKEISSLSGRLSIVETKLGLKDFEN